MQIGRWVNIMFMIGANVKRKWERNFGYNCQWGFVP